MALIGELGEGVTPDAGTARLAAADIVLWTTKDGREMPLDDMTSDHITNAIRVLSLWRQRLKKRGRDEAIIGELANAITRFKQIERRRRKASQGAEGDELSDGTGNRRYPKPKSSFGSRPMGARKPVRGE